MLRVESADGVHFTGKTLLMTNDNFPADMTNHVRDPQIIQRDGRLYMLLGGRTQADVGCALVYESGDGSHFRLVNRLSTAEPFGYMWECPDLAVLDGQPLLICCPQGIPHQPFCYQNAHQCGCFALEGDFAAGAALGAFQPFDYGFDLYAARTLKASDGRVLLFAWMGMSETSYGRNPSASQGWDRPSPCRGNSAGKTGICGSGLWPSWKPCAARAPAGTAGKRPASTAAAASWSCAPTPART